MVPRKSRTIKTCRREKFRSRTRKLFQAQGRVYDWREEAGDVFGGEIKGVGGDEKNARANQRPFTLGRIRKGDPTSRGETRDRFVAKRNREIRKRNGRVDERELDEQEVVGKLSRGSKRRHDEHRKTDERFSGSE